MFKVLQVKCNQRKQKRKEKWLPVSSFLFEIEWKTIKGKRRKMTVLNHSSFDDST